MAITSTMLVKRDMEIDGKMLPAGEYEGVLVPPFPGSATEPPHPGTWRLLSRYGVFDVGPQIASREIVPLLP